MDRVVMIWLDAFSSRYLDPQTVPFIHQLSLSGLCTTLKPLFAFSGVGLSALTGTRVNTHKVWCDCVLRQSERPPPVFRWLLRLCDCIPDDILNQYSRSIVHRLFRYNPGIPNLVPVELVDYFQVKEQKRLTEENAVEGITTLFDQLRQHHVKYLTTGLYESVFEGAIVPKALRAIEQDYRFILLKLGSLDRVGHKHGPDSAKMRRTLRRVDDIVRRMVRKAEQQDRPTGFVLFSDHGMTPITRQVNLPTRLARLPLEIRRDYILFLNSTVAGFWFKNAQAREFITKELGSIEQGVVLDKPALQALGIDEIGSEYGELLFALKEGTVFFPDFYRRRRPPRGMHGAAYSSYDRPPFIVYAPAASRTMEKGLAGELIDLVPTVLDLLGVPAPASCEGKSLLGT